jgi:hypothetical protein
MNTPTTPPTSDVPQDPDLPDVPATADPAPDDALADEVFVDDDATRSLPTTPSATGAAGAVGATGATTATVTATPEAPEQEWLKGPAPFALVLGLLGLVVAGATLLSELADVNVPWDDLGPWSVVAAGIVVLLVGAIGLRSSRARH